MAVLFVTSVQAVSLAKSLSGDANSLLLKTNESKGRARGSDFFADLDMGAKVAIASSAVSTVGKLARVELLPEAAVTTDFAATEATKLSEIEAKGTKTLGTLVEATSEPGLIAESKVETADSTEIFDSGRGMAVFFLSI